jgi:hypothetical protein
MTMGSPSHPATSVRIVSWPLPQKCFSLVALVTLMLVSSCSSPSTPSALRMADLLKNFSAMVEEASLKARAALDELENADVDKSAYKASNAKELGEDLFTPFLEDGDVEQRLLVFNGLSMYASSLKQLAGLNKTADINNAQKDLRTKLHDLSKDISKVADVKNPIPTGVLDAIAQIGQPQVNLEEADSQDKAVVVVMEAAAPDIGNVCKLISLDFSALHGIFHEQLQYSYRILETAANEVFKSSKDSQAKLKAARDYGLLLKKKKHGLGLLNSVALSYRKIAEAHENILHEAKSAVQPGDALDTLTRRMGYIMSLLVIPVMVSLLAGIGRDIVNYRRQRDAIKRILITEINDMLNEAENHKKYLSREDHEWLKPRTKLTETPAYSMTGRRGMTSVLPSMWLLPETDMIKVLLFYSHFDRCEGLLDKLFHRLQLLQQSGNSITSKLAERNKIRTCRIIAGLNSAMQVKKIPIDKLCNLPSTYYMPTADEIAEKLKKAQFNSVCAALRTQCADGSDQANSTTL